MKKILTRILSLTIATSLLIGMFSIIPKKTYAATQVQGAGAGEDGYLRDGLVKIV